MPTDAPRAPTTPLAPIDPRAFGPREARRLLWRAGFGGSPEQVATLAAWGPERSVDFLLGIENVPYDRPTNEFRDDIMTPPGAQERADVDAARRARDEEALARLRLLRQQAQAEDRRQMAEIQRWWLARMIESPRPLEEKMTLFWHGHFATSYRTIENSHHMLAQNRLFRAHALGNFGELLFAVIRDPAMLAYLDNQRSRQEAPNENLARELMELFSLGVGAYTEQDIKDGARALTGYSFEGNDFVFRRDWHDEGAKTILGRKGRLDGDDFVRAILEQRACADFLAWKLYRYFVADLPPDFRDIPPGALPPLKALAAVILEHRYGLKPALRRLFLSAHFYDASAAMDKVKSPAELTVGAVRSLGAPTRDLALLCDALDLMGQDLFFPPNVAGWPGGRAWINTSTLYIRQNTLAFLITGATPAGANPLAGAEPYDPRPTLRALGVADAGPDRTAAALADHMLGRAAMEARPQRVAAAAQVIRAGAPTSDPRAVVSAMALLAAAPEHQLC